MFDICFVLVQPQLRCRRQCQPRRLRLYLHPPPPLCRHLPPLQCLPPHLLLYQVCTAHLLLLVLVSPSFSGQVDMSSPEMSSLQELKHMSDNIPILLHCSSCAST